MITAIVVILCSICGYCAYSDGETGACWVSVGIALFAIWLHIGAVDEAKAEINWEHYWLNGGPNGNHDSYTSTGRHTQRKSRRSAEETERRRLAEIQRSQIPYDPIPTRSEPVYTHIRSLPTAETVTIISAEKRLEMEKRKEACLEYLRERQTEEIRRAEIKKRLKPGEGLFECRTCGKVIIGRYRTKGLWDGRAVREYYCPECKTMKQTYVW